MSGNYWVSLLVVDWANLFTSTLGPFSQSYDICISLIYHISMTTSHHFAYPVRSNTDANYSSLKCPSRIWKVPHWNFSRTPYQSLVYKVASWLLFESCLFWSGYTFLPDIVYFGIAQATHLRPNSFVGSLKIKDLSKHYICIDKIKILQNG